MGTAAVDERFGGAVCVCGGGGVEGGETKITARSRPRRPQPVEKLQQAAGSAAEPWEISEGTWENCLNKSVACVTLTS